MGKLQIGAALLVLALATPATAETRQEIYNAAQAAFDRGDMTSAATGFARVLADPQHPSRTDGIIRSRYARALIGLGRINEAIAAAREAVKEFSSTAKPDVERIQALLTLGDTLRADLQMDAAINVYNEIRQSAGLDEADRTRTDFDLILAAMVVRPDLASSIAKKYISDQTHFDALDKSLRAQILQLGAEAALNKGDEATARSLIDRAIKLIILSGTKISLLQSVISADGALIYTLSKDLDRAHFYLAYSGAPYVPEKGWLRHASLPLPTCDDVFNPQDVAVVQIAIDPRGHVIGVQPIYASRSGEMGLVAARAVQQWQWPTYDVARLDPFWRLAVRFEIRCVSRPEPQQLSDSFKVATSDWLETKGIYLGLETDDRGRISSRRDEPIAPSSLSATLVAFAIEADTPGTDEHRSRKDQPPPTLSEMEAILAKAGAPADVRAFIAYWGIRGIKSDSSKAEALRANADTIAAMPGGIRAAAWLQTEAAINDEAAHKYGAARASFDQVLRIPSTLLPASDPIRAVATFHLASIDVKRGDQAAATARVESIGLDAQQCSLLDLQQVRTDHYARSFTDEIGRWGFFGAVRESFDITPAGRVTNIRTVLAQPPFVYDDLAKEALSNARFTLPANDGQMLGCTANTTSFTFQGVRSP